MKVNEIQLNEVDINQVASQLEFLPTKKKSIPYKNAGKVGLNDMPAFSYMVSPTEQQIDTITSDGKETTNVARQGDIIISGPSKEKYVMKPEKFQKMYQGNFASRVIPEQTPRMVAHYTGTDTVTFMASWGEQMILKPGDYLVKDGEHYYRIARAEYEKTYNPPGR